MITLPRFRDSSADLASLMMTEPNSALCLSHLSTFEDYAKCFCSIFMKASLQSVPQPLLYWLFFRGTGLSKFIWNNLIQFPLGFSPPLVLEEKP